MFGIQVSQVGGPEALAPHDDLPDPEPGPDEVLVAVTAAGVNYIDTYYREGIYPRETPFVPGLEGTGRVLSDPRGEIAPGTRVAWCDAFGSYAEKVAVPRDRLVAVPAGMDAEVAASMLLQGITAHYLVHGVYPLREGSTCLITAGAGGVGLMATQLAAAAGARVISVTSTAEKAELAREAGAETVLRYGADLARRVRELTGGAGVDVVHDGVGRDTFAQSLAATRERGVLCLFGAASGPVDPVDPQELNRHGSIYLTRPSIGAWTSREGEFAMRAQAVTRAIRDGVLRVRVGAVFPLAEAERAHRELQARRTTGSVVLRVE